MLVAVLVVFSLVTLLEILNVVVFAITVAYVLFPLRMRLTRYGLSNRISSALATSVAFLFVVILVVPVVYVAHRRRGQLLGALEEIPDTVAVTLAGTELSVETAALAETAKSTISDLAVQVALAAPSLVLELAVFTLLLYGMLLRPSSIRDAAFELVPSAHHDILSRLHQRTRDTLYSIYVIQAATAVGTFLIALVVYLGMGYPSPLLLAVVSGILQFVPILGPSVLILGLAGWDVMLGDPNRAIVLVVVGLVLIGFVPDAIIRTRLAGRSGELPASLYFVGFVGGILTVGAIGIIVGPLVVALLIEVVDILSDHGEAVEATRSERRRDRHGEIAEGGDESSSDADESSPGADEPSQTGQSEERGDE